MGQRALFVINVVLLVVIMAIASGQARYARADSSQRYEIREAGIVKCADGIHFCVNSRPPDNIDDTWQVKAYDSRRDLLVMERSK